MASEKFANRPESTVAVAYTATDTSLEVDDASDFPSEGVFRVILGNPEGTIFRVDSVAGDVFTGAAEEFDADASIGATVNIVASKAVAERFVQSQDDGTLHAPTGTDGAAYVGPLNAVTPFDDTGFSWLNQGSSTHAVVGGTSHLVIPQNSGQAIRGRVKTLPAKPVTITVLFDTVMESSASQAAMFGFRESATGNILVFRLEQGTVRVSNGTTTIAGDVYAKNWNGGRAHDRLWLQIEADGTNVKFRFSWDGVNFLEILSETETTHFTTEPDQVAILGYDQNNSSFLHINTLSYKES